MLKKLFFATILAALVALPFGSLAAAQTPPPPGAGEGIHKGRGTLGQVVALGDSDYTVHTLRGEDVTYLVNPSTEFKFQDGSEASFDDLALDGWVATKATPGGGGSGQAVAQMVIIMPEDFVPPEQGLHLRGEVTDIGIYEFGLQTEDGQSHSIAVNDATRFGGDLTGLSDMEVGMQVGVLAVEQPDGSLLALGVGTGDFQGRGNRYGGKVADVDVAGSAFSIVNREGVTTRFNVNESTEFHSRDGSVDSLDDLQADMPVMVAAQESDGGLLALAVFVGDPELFTGEHAGGTVTGVGTDTFTIVTRGGETLTFLVNNETQFRSHDGLVAGLEDLENGMRVAVTYETQADGTLLAKLVAVGEPGRPGRPGGPPPGSQP